MMVEMVGVLVACHNLRYPPKQNQPQQTVYGWQTPHPIPLVETILIGSVRQILYY